MVNVSRLSDELRKANTKNLGVRDISRRAKELGETLSPSNISNYMRGNHPERPPEKTLVAFAKVFDVPVSDLEEAATFTGREPFTPDPSADRLTPPQRAVLNELIRVMTDENEKAGEGDYGKATSNRQAAGSAATDGPNLQSVPDIGQKAAYRTGKETQKQRLDREADERDSGSQDPEDWRE